MARRRTLRKTVVRREIEIEPGQPVESDNPIEPPGGRERSDLRGKVLCTRMIGQAARREQFELNAIGRSIFALPRHCGDCDLMTAPERGFGDPQHVALKPPVREIAEDRKQQPHACNLSSESSARISR